MAEYSRVQARGPNVEELRRINDERDAQRKERFKAYQAEMDRGLTWLARIGVIPLSLLVLGLVFVLVSGLWSGEIHQAGKHAKGYVSRETSPFGFWLAAVFHALSVALFGYLAVSAWKKSGWLPRGPKSGR